MNRLLFLIGGSLVFWLVVAIPARLIWGDPAAFHAGTAMLLCLLPSLFTMTWANRTSGGPPEQQLIAVLGGTGLRMFVVLLGAWALFTYVPYFHEHAGFWIWVIVFYLFTLVSEKVLVLNGRPSPRSRSEQAR